MSLCSSNITKDKTPIKSLKTIKLMNSEDIDLVESISCIIEDTIKRNSSRKKHSKKTIFFCEDEAIIPVSTYCYIYNIYSCLNLEMSTIVLSLININRLLERSRDYLSMNNFHKLFITSCLLNSKINEDVLYGSDCYALAGKIDKNELIFLEGKFFEMVDYKLFVNDEVYRRYYNFIKNRVIKQTNSLDSKKD